MPLVSVIIPVFNQLPFVMKCVNSLVSEAPPATLEIILADDCSPDFNLTELLGPPFTVLRSETNRGYAATCNQGALKASGKLLFFLNSDTQAQPGWLAPMVQAFDTAQVGIVGPKLLFPDGTVQSCGGQYDAGRGPYHRYLGFDGAFRAVNRPGVVSWITGAAQMLPRELFLQLGGYDEGFGRGYFEDVDLCEAVKATGRTIWYEPRAVFLHHAGASTNTVAKSATEQRAAANSFRANSLRFHERWDKAIKPDTDQLFVNY